MTGLALDSSSPYLLCKTHPNGVRQRIYCIGSLAEVLAQLLDWLRRIGKPVVLVAHNGHAYDARILIYHLERSVHCPIHYATVDFA